MSWITSLSANSLSHTSSVWCLNYGISGNIGQVSSRAHKATKII